ncbi:MAG: SoxR reducing system RseC family protein [Lentimicrobium sp.]|jgi:sigma-E factor negative regulatory protein RseC|nr:SoxR reducing system RseC family protein [Lentimicrobium sp.]
MSSTDFCAIKAGRVHHIQEDQVFVEVTALSACASCHAKGVCGAAESGQRLIEAEKPEGIQLKPGEEVWINAHPRAGHKAVIIGYVIPFIFLVLVLIVASGFTGEVYAGMLALASLLPYYLLVYLFRNRIATHFRFTLSTKSGDL